MCTRESVAEVREVNFPRTWQWEKRVYVCGSTASWSRPLGARVLMMTGTARVLSERGADALMPSRQPQQPPAQAQFRRGPTNLFMQACDANIQSRRHLT